MAGFFLKAHPPTLRISLCPLPRVGLDDGVIDMLVRLYDLPDSAPLLRDLAQQNILVRRIRAFEKHTLAAFIASHFSAKWVSEAEVATCRQPTCCFIATRDREILGFACFDVTARGFFGPTGVAEKARGLGLGKALLLRSLEALREQGHAYAVIGGVGPREFYAKACGAIEIPGSDPGIYHDILP
jgi:predicted N-acetyltransferase YhbS